MTNILIIRIYKIYLVKNLNLNYVNN